MSAHFDSESAHIERAERRQAHQASLDLPGSSISAQGLEPPDIARETAHSLKSVERYLKDYERVKLLLKRGLGAEEISQMIGRGRTVVLEYIQIAQEYHPDLFSSLVPVGD